MEMIFMACDKSIGQDKKRVIAISCKQLHLVIKLDFSWNELSFEKLTAN